MAFPATADPLRFEEAVAWFAARFPVTEALKAQLGEYAGARAWTVAGVTQLDVLLDVFRRLEHAIQTGQPLDDFKRDVSDALTKAWGKRDPHRIETIYRTNLQKAYNAGRWTQGRKLTTTRPWWQYDAILDGRTSDTCNARDGVLLRFDDAFWLQNVPPLHHRCRSTIRFLTDREAGRRGGERGPVGDLPDAGEGFGLPPIIDDPTPVDMTKFPPELRAMFEQKRANAAQLRRPRRVEEIFESAEVSEFEFGPDDDALQRARKQMAANIRRWERDPERDAIEEGISAFTFDSDYTIRQIQTGKPREQLIRERMEHLIRKGRAGADVRAVAEEHVDDAIAALRGIDRVFSVSKPTTSIKTVFRGLGGVSDADATSILNGSTLTMRGQHSSSSWAPDVALKFIEKNAKEDRWNILLKLKHRSGVLIEDWSAVPAEGELLLPGGARFKVTGVKRLKSTHGGRGTLILEGEEL